MVEIETELSQLNIAEDSARVFHIPRCKGVYGVRTVAPSHRNIALNPRLLDLAPRVRNCSLRICLHSVLLSAALC